MNEFEAFSKGATQERKFPVLTPLERKRGPVRAADIDPIPSHVVRLHEYEATIHSSWVGLYPAAHLLILSFLDVLRIWYSGLCDAAILDSDRGVIWRGRFLQLHRWTTQEGLELMEAVKGKERLAGLEKPDLGRVGLVEVVGKWISHHFSAGLDLVTEQRHVVERVYALHNNWDNLKRHVSIISDRFEVVQVDTHHIAGHEVGRHLYIIDVVVDDLVMRTPLGLQWQLVDDPGSTERYKLVRADGSLTAEGNRVAP